MIDLREGDALEVLRALPAHSAHALVTDPPAGISFMGKAWDGDRGGRDKWVAWLAEVLAEARRVLRPGAHALVWALPRTAHWTACALEDAGFEVRDVVVHVFGSGFPKSLDVSKALDKAAGAERPQIGTHAVHKRPGIHGNRRNGARTADAFNDDPRRQSTRDEPLTTPATDAARQWSGWGTALKPAAEHWILARSPLEGTVASNVLEHGTGALNVDGCRVGLDGESAPSGGTRSRAATWSGSGLTAAGASTVSQTPAAGRWPANVCFSGDAVAELDAQSGHRRAGANPARRGPTMGYQGSRRAMESGVRVVFDSGGASRFFYCPKASRRERGEGNVHPTVKPLELMRWLVRLVTPPGGVVLDPFAGSGTTAVACELEGASCIAIEREAEYAEIARRRVRALAPLLQVGHGG